MAVRRPLKLDGSNNLVTINATELAALRAEAIRQFALNPAIVLQFDSVGTPGTTIGTLVDTRKAAGATATNISVFPNAAATPDITTVTVNWNKIAETVLVNQNKPIDSGDRGYPLWSDAGTPRAMSDSDWIDTIIIPAINKLTASSLDESDAGGTFYISTLLSDPDGTIVNTNPVFTDTRADSALYTAPGIPETLDQPKNIQSYYLHKIGAPNPPALPRLAYVRSDGNIQVMTKSNIKKKIDGSMKWATNKLVGYRIRYSLDSNGGPGVNRGTGMVNTALSGTGRYQQRLINTNDYRTQEFPNGTPQTVSTRYLKIKKT